MTNDLINHRNEIKETGDKTIRFVGIIENEDGFYAVDVQETRHKDIKCKAPMVRYFKKETHTYDDVEKIVLNKDEWGGPVKKEDAEK